MNPKILILSGPTHEYMDPVRFIGNASSGRMGKALAEEAETRGYTVEFVSGPVAESNLPNVSEKSRIHTIISAEEMLNKAAVLFGSADIVIFAAAVADYAPAEKMSKKMAKSDKNLLLKLRPTPDIAKTLCAGKRPGQICIGFALQSHDGETNARRKLAEKNLDGVVLNTPATLGAENGTFSFLSKENESFSKWGCIDKNECAKKILHTIQRA